MQRKGDLPFDGRVSFVCSWTKVRMDSFSRSTFLKEKVFHRASIRKYSETQQELQKYGII